MFLSILLLAKKDLCVMISRFSQKNNLLNISSTQKSSASDFFEKKDECKVDCRLMTQIVLTSSKLNDSIKKSIERTKRNDRVVIKMTIDKLEKSEK